MRSGGAIPPHKRGISAILARHPMKTWQKACDTLSVILSRKGIARYGGVSRTGPLSAQRQISPKALVTKIRVSAPTPHEMHWRGRGVTARGATPLKCFQRVSKRFGIPHAIYRAQNPETPKSLKKVSREGEEFGTPRPQTPKKFRKKPEKSEK